MADTLYFLFTGDVCAAIGGVEDYEATFDTLEEAQAAYEFPSGEWSCRQTWAHVAIVEDRRLKVVSETCEDAWREPR